MQKNIGKVKNKPELQIFENTNELSERLALDIQKLISETLKKEAKIYNCIIRWKHSDEVVCCINIGKLSVKN